MPRLTDAQYLHQRQALRVDWFEDNAWTFGRLDPMDEMDLHAYFAPTKTFTDEQAIAHRAAITTQYPSLPQSAGRAYARALVYLGKRSAPQPIVKRPARRVTVKADDISVCTVMRPEPDVPKLIRALKRIRDEDEREAV